MSKTKDKLRVIPPPGQYYTPDNKPFCTPTPGAITIVATTPNKGESAPSQELCHQLKECGFNSALMTITLSEIPQALTNCGNAGIKLLLYHSHLTRDETYCREFVNRFKDNINLGGWELKGQPTFNELSNPNSFRKYYDLISELDSAHCIYVSLVGGPVPEYMNGHTYRDYIEKFQDTLNPSFFPYVLYPITGTDSQPNVRYNVFFNDLEIFALVAKYTGRQFWAYVRSQSFSTIDGATGPTPTEGEIRFAAFSALAYGAQGLVYWTYRLRNNTTTESYGIAPIDRNGVKTKIWTYVRNVNNDIMALNDVFCGAYFIECRHTGATQYRGYYSYELTSPMGPCKSVKTNGKGVLVSILNNKGKDYLVVVNHDVALSQAVEIDFCDYWKITEIITAKGNRRSNTISELKISRTLIPGGCVIFSWE